MCDGEGASKLLFFFETVHVVKKLDSACRRPPAKSNAIGCSLLSLLWIVIFPMDGTIHL